MLKGCNGAIVRVDLTTGEISYEKGDEAIARKYIGGVAWQPKCFGLKNYGVPES